MYRTGKYRTSRLATFGFTLIEMAIVLGVAGLLFTGLWRLLATGNAQMRDQATASQQAQLAASINTYLQSSEGQSFMGALAPNTSGPLTLPPLATPAGNAGCAAALGSHGGLCAMLPPGTNVTTANPYGQTYSVQILKDNSATNVAPQTYSFMIMTSGGETISDTSGGRISAMIGNDGGFIYSTDVCTTGSTFANTACGSYGSWSSTWASYGFAAGPGVGHIASRTYYAPSQSLSDYWLARKLVPGDTTFTYNTMQTPMYLNGNAVYFGATAAATTGGGLMNMAAGTLNVQGGTIALGTSGKISGSGDMIVANGANPFVNLSSSTCTKATFNDSTCAAVLSITGDETVSNLLSAHGLYADTFIYQGSDIRLKTNVQNLSDPLNDIMKLKPVSFAYKAGGKESMGVIAQDLEKVYPQLVASGPAGLKAVSYEGLIAPLIGAVQELKKENDELRQELRAQRMYQEKMDGELTKLRH